MSSLPESESTAYDSNSSGQIPALAHEAVENMNALINSSMKMTMEDYELLSELNTVAASRYAVMTEKAASFTLYLDKMMEQCMILFGY